jgi:hypothetical protein
LSQKYLNKCTGNTQKIYTAAIESQHLRYAPRTETAFSEKWKEEGGEIQLIGRSRWQDKKALALQGP